MYSDYNYGSSYNNYSNDMVAGLSTGFMILYIFYYIIAIGISVFQIIAMWKMFKKAGRNGWEAIIPFYNIWVLFEISGYPGYYVLFILIPCFGPLVLFIFEIIAYISLSKKFNKSGGFAALFVFLPVVAYAILGFGSDEYDDTLGEHKNTTSNEVTKVEVKETKTTKTTTKTDNKFCGNCGEKVAKTAKNCPNCGKEL